MIRLAVTAAALIYAGVQLERYLKRRKTDRMIDRIMKLAKEDDIAEDDPFRGRVEWVGPRLNSLGGKA